MSHEKQVGGCCKKWNSDGWNALLLKQWAIRARRLPSVKSLSSHYYCIKCRKFIWDLTLCLCECACDKQKIVSKVENYQLCKIGHVDAYMPTQFALNCDQQCWFNTQMEKNFFWFILCFCLYHDNRGRERIRLLWMQGRKTAEKRDEITQKYQKKKKTNDHWNVFVFVLCVFYLLFLPAKFLFITTAKSTKSDREISAKTPESTFHWQTCSSLTEKWNSKVQKWLSAVIIDGLIFWSIVVFKEKYPRP